MWPAATFITAIWYIRFGRQAAHVCVFVISLFFFCHKFFIFLVFGKNYSLEQFVVISGRERALQSHFRMKKVMKTCGLVGAVDRHCRAGSTGLGEAGPQLCDTVGTRILVLSSERLYL